MKRTMGISIVSSAFAGLALALAPYPSFVGAEPLAGSVDCLRGACVGHAVIGPKNETGTVEEIFANGTARVKIAGRPWTRTWDLDRLAKSAGCLDGICPGDLVVDLWSDIWEVEDVFADGRARVRSLGLPWSGTRDVSSLSTDIESFAQAKRRGGR